MRTSRDKTATQHRVGTGRVGMSDWLICRTRRPSAPVRLYCVPHSGGTAGEYLRWADQLAGVEVWAVQLPGRGSRQDEVPYTRMAPLVRDLLASVEFQPPFVLFGHSLGALVAYEVAQELRAAGRPAPDWLFASGYGAPHLPRRATPLHGLSDDDLLPHLLAGTGELPGELLDDEEYLKLVLSCYRSDLEVVETYEYRPRNPLGNPVTVLGGVDDDGDITELAGWRGHTSARFELHLLPGDHFYLRPERDAVLRLVIEAVRQL